MTREEVVKEIIYHLARDAVIGWEQVQYWPEGIIESFIKAGWITSISAALEIECPGCEQNCFKRVHIVSARNGQLVRPYVACDMRNDMGRIEIGIFRLEQWQITGRGVADWVSRELGFNSKPESDATNSRFKLGSVQGEKRVGDLELVINDTIYFKVSEHLLPLSQAVDFEDGVLKLDQVSIINLIDIPPTLEFPDGDKPRGNNSIKIKNQQEDLELGSPEWRKENARKAANARHDQPDGSRNKQQRICEIWATGKYSTRDRCAEEECGALGISFSAARKALRNTPDPSS